MRPFQQGGFGGLERALLVASFTLGGGCSHASTLEAPMALLPSVTHLGPSVPSLPSMSAVAPAHGASFLRATAVPSPAPTAVSALPLDGVLESTPLGGEVPGGGSAGGSIAGSVLAPGTLAAAYRTSAIALRPVSKGYVFLCNSAGEFYSYQGKVASTTTDGQGRYSFGTLTIAPGTPILARAYFLPRETLSAATLVRSGANDIQIDAATTFVSFYLEHLSAALARPLASLGAASWQGLDDLTTQAIASGQLTFSMSDFEFGNRNAALADYERALAKDADLASKWNAAIHS